MRGSTPAPGVHAQALILQPPHTMALRPSVGCSSMSALRPRTNAMRPVSGLRPTVGRKTCVAPVAVFDNKNNNQDGADRLIASLPYLLPLLDVLPYGKFLFMQYPFIARAMSPLLPIYGLYTSFPFAPFLVFLAVYSFIVNNQSLSRFVRYNAMQAVLLDILLVFPQLLLNDIGGGPGDGAGLTIYMQLYNTIFLFVACSCAYGMGSSLIGQVPRLPLVAGAADAQIRGGPGGM
eukprot:gene31580-6778_t